MHVKSWNTYNIDGSGKLIVGVDFKHLNAIDALDEAEKQAKAWNARHKKDIDSRVNMITCSGFVRVVL